MSTRSAAWRSTGAAADTSPRLLRYSLTTSRLFWRQRWVHLRLFFLAALNITDCCLKFYFYHPLSCESKGIVRVMEQIRTRKFVTWGSCVAFSTSNIALHIILNMVDKMWTHWRCILHQSSPVWVAVVPTVLLSNFSLMRSKLHKWMWGILTSLLSY